MAPAAATALTATAVAATTEPTPVASPALTAALAAALAPCNPKGKRNSTRGTAPSCNSSVPTAPPATPPDDCVFCGAAIAFIVIRALVVMLAAAFATGLALAYRAQCRACEARMPHPRPPRPEIKKSRLALRIVRRP